MRGFRILKAKTGEEICRCGSEKSAKRWVARQREEYIIIQITPDGQNQIKGAKHEKQL